MRQRLTNLLLFLFTFGATILTSCGKDKEVCVDEYSKFTGYIAFYYHTSEKLSASCYSVDNMNGIHVSLDLASRLPKEEENALAVSINDTLTYWYMFYKYDTRVVVDRAVDFDVTANKAFDSEHPAGSSLKSFFSVAVDDHFAYVTNGYKVPDRPYYTGNDLNTTKSPYYERATYNAPMDRTDWHDFVLLPYSFLLDLTTPPDSTGEYTFTVTFEMENGIKGSAQTAAIWIKGRE